MGVFGVYGFLTGERGSFSRILSEVPFLCQWFPVTVTATAFEWILRFDCWPMMLLVLRSRDLKGTCRFQLSSDLGTGTLSGFEVHHHVDSDFSTEDTRGGLKHKSVSVPIKRPGVACYLGHQHKITIFLFVPHAQPT